MPDSPRSIIAKWPSLEALASDIGASLYAVRKWPARGAIPSEYWDALVKAAARRSLSGVTLEALAAMHARRPLGEASPSEEAVRT